MYRVLKEDSMPVQAVPTARPAKFTLPLPTVELMEPALPAQPIRSPEPPSQPADPTPSEPALAVLEAPASTAAVTALDNPQSQPPEEASQPSLPSSPRAAISKRLSPIVISLLLLSALLMLLSGVGILYYSAVARPSQLQAQATATVQSIQTSIAQGTVVANAQATALGQHDLNATATAHTEAAQATAEVVATDTAGMNIYQRATSAPPALVSPLSVNDANNWDEYRTVDGGGCGIYDGALHVTLSTPGNYVPCFAQRTSFSNFAFQVEMIIGSGDEGGLVFRGNDAQSQFYFFRVGRDGNYSLYVSRDATHSLVLAFGHSSVIQTAPGQVNILSVVAQGSSLYLYINKHFVDSARDSTYSTGSIGVFAGSAKDVTSVTFNNAMVWRL